MRIVRIDITNFRGIRELEAYRPQAQNLLVGANNTGKTTILQALDFLLNPDRYWNERSITDLDFYDRDVASGFAIEAWLGEMSLDDWASCDWDLYREFINPSTGTLTEDTSCPAVLRMRMECREVCGSIEYSFHYPKPDADHARITNEAKGRIGFRYISGNRDPLKELSFYQNSVLAKLLESPGLHEQIKEIITALDKAGDLLKGNTRLTASLNALRGRLADFGLLDRSRGDLGLSVLSLSRRRLLQSFDLVIRQQENSPRIPLAYHGLGIQNAALAFAILQYLENQERENVILAFEEPEQNLEPALQRVLCQKLSTTIPAQTQLFISTHSPEVARFFPLRTISIVRAGGDGHRVIPLQGKDALPKAEEAFFRRLEQFWMEALLRCAFAQCILIGEGGTEEGVLPVFFQELGPEDEQALLLGIEVVSPCTEGSQTGGIDEIHRFTQFLHGLGVPVVALTDASSDDLAKLPAISAAANWVIHWPSGDDIEAAIVRSFPEESAIKAVGSWIAEAKQSTVQLNTAADVANCLRAKWKNPRWSRQVARCLCKQAREDKAPLPMGPVRSLLKTLVALRKLSPASEGPVQITIEDGRTVVARRQDNMSNKRNVYEIVA